jgi:hypothetical protein
MNIPLDEWSGSKATKELQDSIAQFNATNAKQTAQLLILTWVIAILTFLMLVGLAVQIYLATK